MMLISIQTLATKTSVGNNSSSSNCDFIFIKLWETGLRIVRTVLDLWVKSNIFPFVYVWFQALFFPRFLLWTFILCFLSPFSPRYFFLYLSWSNYFFQLSLISWVACFLFGLQHTKSCRKHAPASNTFYYLLIISWPAITCFCLLIDTEICRYLS